MRLLWSGDRGVDVYCPMDWRRVSPGGRISEMLRRAAQCFRSEDCRRRVDLLPSVERRDDQTGCRRFAIADYGTPRYGAGRGLCLPNRCRRLARLPASASRDAGCIQLLVSTLPPARPSQIEKVPFGTPPRVPHPGHGQLRSQPQDGRRSTENATVRVRFTAQARNRAGCALPASRFPARHAIRHASPPVTSERILLRRETDERTSDEQRVSGYARAW